MSRAMVRGDWGQKSVEIKVKTTVTEATMTEFDQRRWVNN